MKRTRILIIPESYSRAVGGADDGIKFRELILIPIYDSLLKHEVLCVDFDGGFGYPTSFLKEAFGGLSKIYGKKALLKKLTFVSQDEPGLIDDVLKYIRTEGAY